MLCHTIANTREREYFSTKFLKFLFRLHARLSLASTIYSKEIRYYSNARRVKCRRVIIISGFHFSLTIVRNT